MTSRGRTLALVAGACVLVAGCSELGQSSDDPGLTTTMSPAAAATSPGDDLTLLRPTILSEASTGMFISALELESGTTIALGADDQPGAGGQGANALWRSTDGAASFERIDLAAFPLTGGDEVVSIAEHDGVVYLFGSDWSERQIVVWTSRDEAASWTTNVVGSGLAVWGGVIGGRPTVAVVEGAGADIDAGIYQLVDGAWRDSSIPKSGDQAMVYTAAEGPDGGAVAVGTTCPTSPDCSIGDEPAATFVWTSDDGGATWAEADRVDGTPNDPSTVVVSDGPVTVAAIAGSDDDGVVRTTLVRISSVGDGIVVGDQPWPNAEGAQVWGVIVSGDTVITAVSVDNGDGSTPYLSFTDLTAGQQDLVNLQAVAGLDFVFGLADIAGTVHALGVARTDDDALEPALVAIAP